MDLDGRREMYKEMYYFEQNRKHKIHSDASIIVAILVPLVGAISFFFHRLGHMFDTCCFLQVIYFLSLAALFVSIAMAIIYVVKALYKYPYGYIAKAEEIETYYSNLIKKHSNQDEQSREEFSKFLIEQYCKCADMNINNNDTKLERLRKAKKAIIFSFLFVTLCTILDILPTLIVLFKQGGFHA